LVSLSNLNVPENDCSFVICTPRSASNPTQDQSIGPTAAQRNCEMR
jgi:hypothetical protein